MTEAMILKCMLAAYTAAAEHSIDPSTQNGAVLVPVGTEEIRLIGFNHPCDGADVDLWHADDREYRLATSVHAELDVVSKCAAFGYQTQGATLVCPWAACGPCALAIINARIRRLVRHKERMDASREADRSWADTIKFADELLEDAGVEIVEYSGRIPGAPKVLHSRKEWTP